MVTGIRAALFPREYRLEPFKTSRGRVAATQFERALPEQAGIMPLVVLRRSMPGGVGEVIERISPRWGGAAPYFIGFGGSGDRREHSFSNM